MFGHGNLKRKFVLEYIVNFLFIQQNEISMLSLFYFISLISFKLMCLIDWMRVLYKIRRVSLTSSNFQYKFQQFHFLPFIHLRSVKYICQAIFDVILIYILVCLVPVVRRINSDVYHNRLLLGLKLGTQWKKRYRKEGSGIKLLY